MSIKSEMPCKYLILCHPLFLLPSICPSIRVFSTELALCLKWPKYWSFSFSVSPSNDYSGLISFRMDCLDLLAVQETLKSLLQHHSSKASILCHSAFFWPNSHIYTWLLALTRQTFVSKVSPCPSCNFPAPPLLCWKLMSPLGMGLSTSKGSVVWAWSWDWNVQMLCIFRHL